MYEIGLVVAAFGLIAFVALVYVCTIVVYIAKDLV